MSKLPQLKPREMIRALERGGFVVKRVTSSHHYLVHGDDPTRRTTVAMHPGDLPRRDVHDILKQTKLSREEFLKLL